MKRIVGWIMVLIAVVAVVIMYAHLLGIVQTLLMFLSLFLSYAWIIVASVLIKSGNDKKGTDSRVDIIDKHTAESEEGK